MSKYLHFAKDGSKWWFQYTGYVWEFWADDYDGPVTAADAEAGYRSDTRFGTADTPEEIPKAIEEVLLEWEDA